MAKDAITVTGIEQYKEALRKMQTDNTNTGGEGGGGDAPTGELEG